MWSSLHVNKTRFTLCLVSLVLGSSGRSTQDQENHKARNENQYKGIEGISDLSLDKFLDKIKHKKVISVERRKKSQGPQQDTLNDVSTNQTQPGSKVLVSCGPAHSLKSESHQVSAKEYLSLKIGEIVRREHLVLLNALIFMSKQDSSNRHKLKHAN